MDITKVKQNIDYLFWLKKRIVEIKREEQEKPKEGETENNKESFSIILDKKLMSYEREYMDITSDLYRFFIDELCKVTEKK